MRERGLAMAVVMLLLAPSGVSGQGTNDDILMDLQREWNEAAQSDADGLTPLQRGSLSTLQFRLLGTPPACPTFAGADACGQVSFSLPVSFNSNPLGAPEQTEGSWPDWCGKVKWRILPVSCSTPNRPPATAATGGMRHGRAYQDWGTAA